MIPDALNTNIRQAEKWKGVRAETKKSSDQIYVIFRDYPIPVLNYNKKITDIMIMTTSEYPKTSLDMFFTPPDIRLADGSVPNATSPVQHLDAEWLQWSIHPYRNGWDPFKDDLVGFLCYIDKRFKAGD